MTTSKIARYDHPKGQFLVPKSDGPMAIHSDHVQCVEALDAEIERRDKKIDYLRRVLDRWLQASKEAASGALYRETCAAVFVSDRELTGAEKDHGLTLDASVDAAQGKHD